MSIHVLKCWPEPFAAMTNGSKVHEFRKNDRGYAVGDILELHRFSPDTGCYSGSVLFRQVTYVGEGFGIPEGYVCMSITKASEYDYPEMKPLCGYGEHCPLDKSNWMWRGDGSAYFATETHYSNVEFSPHRHPTWATHAIYFSK